MGDPEEAAVGTEEESKGGKGKLFIIVGVVVVALVAMLIAAFMIFKGSKDPNSAYDTTPAQKSDNSIMIAFPEPFTLNIAPDAADLLTINITLQISPKEELGYGPTEVREELAPLADDTAGKTKLPLVEEAIGMVLASKTKPEYMSPIGKKQIKTDIQNKLNEILDKGKVTNVIFPKPPLIQ
ncbi:MAG: flagellar basal body-associated FliL family protein [bacterium]